MKYLKFIKKILWLIYLINILSYKIKYILAKIVKFLNYICMQGDDFNEITQKKLNKLKSSVDVNFKMH